MHRKSAAYIVAIVLCISASAVRLTARAETTAEDARDYRISVMSSMGGHVGAISRLVRGRVEDHGFLAKQAQRSCSTCFRPAPMSGIRKRCLSSGRSRRSSQR
jgi:hypothetical protein